MGHLGGERSGPRTGDTEYRGHNETERAGEEPGACGDVLEFQRSRISRTKTQIVSNVAGRSSKD